MAAARTALKIEVCDTLHELRHALDDGRIGLGLLQGGAGLCEAFVLVRRREQAVMSDTLETRWQHVQQETANELAAFEPDGSPFALACLVGTHPEGNLLAVDADNALIGDGDPVGVAPQIRQHLFRPAQGLLGVHHPVMSM